MKLLKMFVVFFVCLHTYSAVEITSVIRDIASSNIFTYKQSLIDSPKANKFSFENSYVTYSTQPDFFIFHLKFDDFYIGKKLNVFFNYRTKNSKTFSSIKKIIIVNKSKECLRYDFTTLENSSNVPIDDPIEYWEISIFDGKEQIATKRNLKDRWFR